MNVTLFARLFRPIRPPQQPPSTAPQPKGIWVVSQVGLQHFIAHRFFCGPTVVLDADEEIEAPTLDALRRKLPAGLINVRRHPLDLPEVVETWI